MARKEKLTLDYFPHYAVQGDISKIIQERYGNDGYAILYKNYEQFCLRDRQYIDLNEFVTLASICAYCKVSEEKYLEVVDTLVKLGAYDVELWNERKILISEKFIENTKDAYRNRTSQNINFVELKNFLRKKSTSECISYVGNRQIKGKETKGKESKGKVVVSSNEKTEIVSGNHSDEKIEIESNNHQTTKTTISKIPSLEEVKAYCLERKNSINAEKFYDYYKSRGWLLASGLPLEDWQAAVRTWERNEKTEIVSGNRNEDVLKCKGSAGRISKEAVKLRELTEIENRNNPVNLEEIRAQVYRGYK